MANTIVGLHTLNLAFKDWTTQQKVEFALDVLKKRIAALPSNVPVKLSFSGGKDSLLTYYMIREVAPKRDVLLVHYDDELSVDLHRKIVFDMDGKAKTKLIVVQEKAILTSTPYMKIYCWDERHPIREKWHKRVVVDIPEGYDINKATDYVNSIIENQITNPKIRTYSLSEGIKRRKQMLPFLSDPKRALLKNDYVFPLAAFSSNNEILSVLKERYGIVHPEYAIMRLLDVPHHRLRSQNYSFNLVLIKPHILRMLDGFLWKRLCEEYPEFLRTCQELYSIWMTQFGKPRLFDTWYESALAYFGYFEPAIAELLKKVHPEHRERFAKTLVYRTNRLEQEKWILTARKMLQALSSK